MQCPHLPTRKDSAFFLGLFIVSVAIIVVAIKPEYLLELLFGIVPTAIKWIKGKQSNIDRDRLDLPSSPGVWTVAAN